jgi:hypothetical protein
MTSNGHLRMNEKRLITAACWISLATPIVCLSITLNFNELPVWVPFVSDLQSFEPADTLFPLGMTFSALMLVMVIPGLHRNLRSYSNRMWGDGGYVPTVFSTFLFIAAFSSIIASHISWSEAPFIHYAAATLLFSTMICGGALFEFVRSFGDIKKVNRLRFATIIMGMFLFFTLAVLSMNNFLLPQDIRYNGDLTERSFSMAIAAYIEWILVADLSLMMWSMRSEFDSI